MLKKLTIAVAIVFGVMAWGAYNSDHMARVCSGTLNPALCEQGLDMGLSDAEAHDRGNV